MKPLFRNKYRTQSHRMPRWDYSGNGYYFITLVTHNRVCNLGIIVEKKYRISMQLSDYGHIVKNEWLKSFELRNELFLDEYIIMPNHLHAIVVLNDTGEKSSCCMNNANDMNDLNKTDVTDVTHMMDVMDVTHVTHVTHVTNVTNVETHGRASLQSTKKPTERTLIRKPKSISSFIAGFKSATNSKIDDYIDEHHLNIPKFNKNNPFFQSNYHDHIIRNDTEYQRIKKYIVNNPFKWNQDNFYSSNRH